MVASHPDMVCPSPEGGLPDTGAYMAMFEATTGVRPVHICGKPQPGMIHHKIEALGLEAQRCAMVGDRLYTDMADEGAEQQPSLIVGSVDELLR